VTENVDRGYQDGEHGGNFIEAWILEGESRDRFPRSTTSTLVPLFFIACTSKKDHEPNLLLLNTLTHDGSASLNQSLISMELLGYVSSTCTS
jgi:hypothetical protein